MSGQIVTILSFNWCKSKSISVTAAIKTSVDTKELKSSIALNTASFIEDVNDMFDSANSKNLYDPNLNRRPLTDNKNQHVFEN